MAARQQQESKLGQHAGSFDVASKQEDEMCRNAADSHKLDIEATNKRLDEDLQPKGDEQGQIKQQ